MQLRYDDAKKNSKEGIFLRISGLENLATQYHSIKIKKPMVFQNPQTDQLNLTSIGERLRFRGEALASWDKQAVPDIRNETVRQMDNFISRVGSLLEQMKTLTLVAQEEGLPDIDRINLQMEIEELRDEVRNYTLMASKIMYGDNAYDMNLSRLSQEVLPDPANNPDPRTMLERARDRILDGEKWDVRETPGSHGLVIVDDENVPSVREILEENDAIILMDAKSAAEGTERLSKNIESLQKVRDVFESSAGAMSEKLNKNEDTEMNGPRFILNQVLAIVKKLGRGAFGLMSEKLNVFSCESV